MCKHQVKYIGYFTPSWHIYFQCDICEILKRETRNHLKKLSLKFCKRQQFTESTLYSSNFKRVIHVDTLYITASSH